jgi:exodeoxyribonuclease V alpha subunit
MSELFTPIENALAERLLLDYPKNSEAAFFIKTLLFAAKKGHLCLYIDEQTVMPALNELFKQDVDENALRMSLQKLPTALLQECQHEINVNRPICQKGNCFYLQRYYIAETIVFQEWQRLCNGASTEILASYDGDQLLKEQIQAVQLVCEKNFVILSGGPGTGKTFTAARMVKAVVQGLPEEKKKNFKIALAAPTGKAASHLENTIRKALTGLPTLEITGQTLHSLLGNRLNHSVACPLPYDFILVDESSMIDVELMASLLTAVSSHSKLVLIGDENQLPPVEAGGIFADLKAIHPFSVALQKCVRAELKELAEFGSFINAGNSAGVLKMIHEGYIQHLDPSKVSYQTFLEYAAERYASEEKSFCLLSPMREGPFGSEAINRFIANAIKKKAKGLFHAPIMISKNDHKKGLFNGEIGILTKHDSLKEQFSALDFARFSQERQFYALLLPRFEYAYCLSVHKSQGSEFDEVILVLPEGSESFGRKIIYTAATRAKKKMTIYGALETLCKTLQTNSERLSGIIARI